MNFRREPQVKTPLVKVTRGVFIRNHVNTRHPNEGLVILVYQQQLRPAETASSCSSVIFGSGGNAICTVCISLS